MARISSWHRAAPCLHSNGDVDKARQSYQKLLDSDPQNAAALFALGVLAQENGSFDEALLWVAQSLELEPTAEKCIIAGKVLEQQNRHAAALVYYRRAKELEPCGLLALEVLAEALDRNQEYEESSGVWARRLRLESGNTPKQLQLRLYLTNALRLAGHLSRAGQVLSQARAMGQAQAE